MLCPLRDDFDPGRIADSGQCFRAVRTGEHSYRFLAGSRYLAVTETEKGVFDLSCTPEEWDAYWFGYFDGGRSYAAIRERIPADDAFLVKAAEEGKGIRVLRQEPWETLVTFILSQRKSIPAIRACVEAVASRWGKPVNTGCETFYTFPTPYELRDAASEDLAECRLGYRARYVRDAVSAVLDRGLDLEALRSADDETLLDSLMSVLGVGIKVAKCTGLFAYSRMSMVPVDTWIDKLISRLYAGRDPFAAFGEDAGIMQQYTFSYMVNRKREFMSLL